MTKKSRCLATCFAIFVISFLATGIPPLDAAETAKPKSATPNKLPGLRKLMDTPLRDTSICHGPDGMW
jgi:hypothetical protein